MDPAGISLHSEPHKNNVEIFNLQSSYSSKCGRGLPRKHILLSIFADHTGSVVFIPGQYIANSYTVSHSLVLTAHFTSWSYAKPSPSKCTKIFAWCILSQHPSPATAACNRTQRNEAILATMMHGEPTFNTKVSA
jgi:hypothetical protein